MADNDGRSLRLEKLKKRDALDNELLTEKSKIIEKKLLDMEEVKKADSIFIYVSFRSEVQTISVIKILMDMGKKISVPITHVKQNRMDAIHIEDMENDLIPGYCGIPEPLPEIIPQNIVSPENIDIVIVPGSVFDERGGRFGYGGGYYDRFLASIPGALRIGLAFELQMIAKAPIQSHDELLDYVITEDRTVSKRRF